MQVNYTVEVELCEVTFQGPKFKFCDNFFNEKKFQDFEENLLNLLKKDFENIFNQKVANSICIDCTASDEENGSYLFDIGFTLYSKLNISSKSNSMKLSKKGINDLEEQINKDAYAKIKKLKERYLISDMDVNEISDWEIIN